MSTQKSRRARKDPQAEREARRYEFPIPSREAILAFLAQAGRPLAFQDVARGLGLEEERDLDALSRRLGAMERDGQIIQNRRNSYGLPEKMDMIRGRVIGHPEGFGFLEPDEGTADLFIPPRQMRQVLHGDRVVARTMRLDPRGRQEVTIIEVLERSQKTVVGRYAFENQISFVVPGDKRINQDVFVPAGREGGAKPGQIVMVEITEQPTLHTQPVGRIVEVIGDHMAPGMETEIAIRKYGLPRAWPEPVLEEVAGLSTEVAEADKSGREDLRGLPLVTIDGEDAKDFDDAVFCERRGKHWRLIVAIADVGNYVKPGTALDDEAYSRGNSVYFPKQVIPMLPEVLSNGLCSLRPDVDRLCIACEMNISASGKIESYRFLEGVMRSHARLTYTKVAAMLVERNAKLRREYDALMLHLEELYALYKVLHRARLKRGAVDFELPETKILFNDQGKIERVVPLERNDAHRLIEECMLAANVCAAHYLRENEAPAHYRIHAGPSPEKLMELRQFLAEMGLRLGGGDEPHARDYAALLADAEHKPEKRLIHTIMLRSLSQAIYSPDNIGHFALAYTHYAHFTSPIRRYPDLLVHRSIRTLLRGRRFEEADTANLKARAEHCSMTERRADEATRDVIRWLKAEYMMDKVGEEFGAIISGVTSFGLFVELADIYVDGLVHIATLGNDYFHFDPSKHRLIGDRTREVFRLGDPLRVRLMRVDLDEAKLDFELVQAPASKKAGKDRASGLRRGKKRTRKQGRA